MDDVYACGFCEREFSRVDELSAHADVCDQVKEEKLEDPEDEGSSVQSNICKTFFSEEADEDEPSAVGNASTEAKNGGSHGCNLCGKTGFSCEKSRDQIQ